MFCEIRLIPKSKLDRALSQQEKRNAQKFVGVINQTKPVNEFLVLAEQDEGSIPSSSTQTKSSRLISRAFVVCYVSRRGNCFL